MCPLSITYVQNLVLMYLGALLNEDTHRSVSVQCSGYIQLTDFRAEATAVETLQIQFSGYGSTPQTVARCLDRLALKEPLEAWSDETVEKVVQTFIDEKFPTVFALNKIDHPDADKVGLFLIYSRYPESVLTQLSKEYQQDREDAGSAEHCPLFCHIRGFPSKTCQSKLYQISRRKRIRRYKRGPYCGWGPGWRRSQGNGREIANVCNPVSCTKASTDVKSAAWKT